MLRSKARLAAVGTKRSRGGRMLATHAAKRLAVPAAPRTQLAAATPSRCLSKSCSCALSSDVSSEAPGSRSFVAPPPFRRLLILQVGGGELPGTGSGMALTRARSDRSTRPRGATSSRLALGHRGGKFRGGK